MRTNLQFLFVTFLTALIFVTLSSIAQEQATPGRLREEQLSRGGSFLKKGESSFRIIPKHPGLCSTADWRSAIDSTWGQGASTAVKLQLFDSFWQKVEDYYGGFFNLPLKWDSLRTLYRPEIQAGVSKGRFAAIMSYMSLALQEPHTWTLDWTIDDPITGAGGILTYRAGVPLFMIGQWQWNYFGAGLSPMPDSSLFVYDVISRHPLELKRGDIILGYNGVPWKKLYRDIIAAQIPVSTWSPYWAASDRGMTYTLLTSAGINWGLFDVIDIVRYATGDTVHLPTSLLANLDRKKLFVADQLPVSGVPMPNMTVGDTLASYGIISGTSIGYIYVYDWSAAAGAKFAKAITALTKTTKTSGIIIDFRHNEGGNPYYANSAFANLFNFDPTSNMCFSIRNDLLNHFGVTLTPVVASDGLLFTPGTTMYDRPIAVLTGPGCWSAGDYDVFRLRFHPMVRMFGMPTNGAYIGGGGISGDLGGGALWSGDWPYFIPKGSVYSYYNNERQLIHKPFAVDEEVWLTRDGAAKGEDDVVKRAVQWMTTLAYAHDVVVPLIVRIGGITITAMMENPLKHQVLMTAIITDASGKRTDSIAFADDGLHGDGAAGDGVWGAYALPRTTAGKYYVSVRVDDLTQGTFHTLSKVQNFTALTSASFFDKGILLVNGVDWTQYETEITSAYQEKIFSGQYPVTFWDCFAAGPANGYPSALPAPIGHGAIPADALTKYSTVIWLGNYYPADGDLGAWLNTPILSYLQSGGNLILLTKNGSAFIDTTLRNYLGITWAELNATLTNSSSLMTGLVSLRTLGTQNLADIFATTPATNESQVLFTSVSSAFGTRAIGMWRKPAGGGSGRSTGGQFIYIAGRPYRWNHTDLQAAMEFILKNYTSEVLSTGRDNFSAVPTEFSLTQNYPNPFNPTTTIQYQIPTASFVTLKIFDVLGREAAVLVNAKKEAGYYSVQWNAARYSSGIYFCAIQAGEYRNIKKMILMK